MSESLPTSSSVVHLGSHGLSARERARSDRAFLVRWSVLAVLGVVAGVVLGQLRARPQIVVKITKGAGVAAEVELFAIADSPTAPSPTPRLGSARTSDDGHTWFDVDLPAEGCLVTASAPGLGIGYGKLEPTGRSSPVELAPPRPVRGAVRDLLGKPVHDADILVLGGGPRGVPLARCRSDHGGEFLVDTIAANVIHWHVRVFARGFAIGGLDWVADAEAPLLVRLEETQPARGRLVAEDPSLRLDGIAVRVLRLPGLSTVTNADGRFELAAIPPAPMRIHPVLDGLPEDYTCPSVWLSAGREVEIPVMRAERVRGFVVHGITGKGLPGVQVFHEAGPFCLEATRTDDDGRFELGRVPHGDVEFRAILDRRQARRYFGREEGSDLPQTLELIRVTPGRATTEIVLRID
ncbi:MAG: hypothetical protein AB7I19_04070 [Planctomycetota bacterium]